MNGLHDVGGMHGYGPVPVADGDAFHAEWEQRCFGLRIAVSRGHAIPASLDDERYVMESIPPHVYGSTSYFERWLHAGEHVYVRDGVLTEAELDARRHELARDPGAPLPSHVEPELVERVLARLTQARSTRREVETEPRFAAGDRVRTRNVHTLEHTRLARYLRGRDGVVDRLHGAFDLPERAARGESRPEHVYEVRFEAAELWGDSAEPNTSVYAQLWDSYLLPA